MALSVNVSRLNFYRPHFVSMLTELIQKYDLEPRNLQLINYMLFHHKLHICYG